MLTCLTRSSLEIVPTKHIVFHIKGIGCIKYQHNWFDTYLCEGLEKGKSHAEEIIARFFPDLVGISFNYFAYDPETGIAKLLGGTVYAD